ncbi:MAG: UvrD-helicase domain-containing protein [Erysipelotrichaceae bacterium]|nr:UvrD-helicase domain-containing protein [Erysipelotrichaceae bacterium]
MPFNQGQLEAIYQRDASILVSAPAGSGKTKILVNRIISLLQEGYNITDFLVVTFTKAAGAEMKQRLTDELNSLISSDIDDDMRQHLSLQLLNMPQAYITNFHTFCSTLLKKYGYIIHVMPGFSIIEDPQYLKEEVIKEYIDKWVQNKDIHDFLELYFPGYSLDSLSELILNIDEVSHSIDDFYQFVENIKEQYYTINTIEDWPLFSYITDIFYQETLKSMNQLIELKVYCEENDLPSFYERPEEQSKTMAARPSPFDAYYDYLDERLKYFSSSYITYDTFIRIVNTPLPKAYTMSWKDVNPKVKDQYNSLKNKILSSYNKAKKDYIEEDIDSFKEKMLLSLNAIEMLVSKDHLLDQFQQAYQMKKSQLNLLDFSDLEKYTHQLLEPQYGIIDILHQQLKEIMIDEYQDTNQIQESLIQKISTYKNPVIPIFMVGDMKQSIYRFRQADPMIFYDKYQTFSLDKNDASLTHNRRIDLIYNYRSTKTVLDSINYIFNAIMDKDIGGLDYYLDDRARLNDDPAVPKKGTSETTEILIDMYDPNSDLDKDQYEAHMVAQRIKKLVDKQYRYKDIVVLMRTTNSFLTFKKVFDIYQIPNHIVLSTGFMKANEVENMISFLKAIDNPYDDIALLSVLRQPYTCSNIDINTIARIKNSQERPLYECLLDSEDPQIMNFLETFNQLKNDSYTCSPYELLKKIYNITDYILFVSQLINGEQRTANLHMLLEVIKQQQNDTPYLHELLDTLDKSSDKSPATVALQNDNVVKFMTIHKSKGLEFPVVFVCNTQRQFNDMDTKQKLILDKQLGITIKPRAYVSTEDFGDIIVEYDHAYRHLIAKKINDDTINEEMRILYVALTRASEKLILTGVLKDYDEITHIQNQLLINNDPDIIHRPGAQNVLLYGNMRTVNNYLYWILAATLRHEQIIEDCLNIPELRSYALKLQQCHLEKYLTFPSTKEAKFKLSITNDSLIEESIPEYSYIIEPYEDSTREYYQNFVYPYNTTKEKSMAVTTLQQIADDHYLNLTDEENNTNIEATDKGTLVHLFMSYLNFKNDDISFLINQLYDEKLIDDLGRDTLIDYSDKLAGFINSDYYQMIKESKYIYKEKTFAYYDQELDQMIHGIFDLVFVYHDKIYVLDYKTDRVTPRNSEASLIKKHQVQLDYYKKVLKEMYHQDITAVVYYLQISKGVEF